MFEQGGRVKESGVRNKPYHYPRITRIDANYSFLELGGVFPDA
jgi:hypothetical protein